jgi:putative hydrolase of the HAD superfamily
LFDHRGSAAAGVDVFVRSVGAAPTPEARDIWFRAEDAEFERWHSGQISFQEQRRRRLRTVLPALGVPAPSEPGELDRLFDVYLRAYRAAWRPFPDSAAVLASLRQEGFRLGILTNGTQEQQIDELRTIGLYDLVDVVCTLEGIGFQKPDPQAFRALAEQLGVMPDECVFVGDNPEHDVAGARSVGMRAVLVDRYGVQPTVLAAELRMALDGR